jgi:hypothetical protein
MSSKLKQALIEALFAGLAFFGAGFVTLVTGWAADLADKQALDLGMAKALLASLALGAVGAATKAVLWYFTGTEVRSARYD